jgi:hypothetical protein
MKKTLFSLLIAVSLIVPVFAQKVTITANERRMAEAITAAQLSNYLYFVASDAMGGRDTPSAGLDVTAEFLKMNLDRWGFKPAGDNGTFFQKMELTRQSLDTDKMGLSMGDRKFTFADDFFHVGGSGAVTGQVVFGGDGWMVKSKNIDAYRGLDVAGKIVVLSSPNFSQQTMIGRPTGVTDGDLSGTRGVDWADPVTYAQSKGAAAVLVVAPPQVMSMWPRLRNFLGRGTTYVTRLREAGDQRPSLPTILVSDKLGDAIFAGESGTKTSAPFQTTKTISLNAASRTEKLMTQNVVALWEGSDPTLKSEMVAIGAHYDHDGIRPNAPGDDKIWNGADDDGSGTVAVLAIAEALAKAKTRPKRSILLVWHAGEEKGLWGAEYFNKFPTVDIKKVIAQLNIDMIGRSKKDGDTNPKNAELTGPNAIYVIGSEMMSSTLGAITKGTNSAFAKLDYNYKYDDPKDPNRFFFRSDHFHYAVNGIPIAFWFDGVHEDYHQPSDTADKIDYQKMERVTRTIFLTMLELADLNERPKVDKQLPPELTQR